MMCIMCMMLMMKSIELNTVRKCICKYIYAFNTRKGLLF